MKKLDALYSSDNRYIDIMIASIISLIENSRIEKLNIHIISYNFKKNEYKKIKNIIEKYKSAKFFLYKLEDFDIEKYHIPNWRDSQIANSRLFFEDILKDELPRIENLLYLDSDTIVVNQLNNLQKYNEKTISAVKDGRKNTLKLLDINMSYNSGVMYINIDKWIEEKCKEKIIEEINQPHTNLNFPDQDILNIALKNDLTELPINYNMMPYEFLFNNIERKLFYNKNIRNRTYEEVEKALKEPYIIHSCGLGSIKAWSNNNVNPFNEEFTKYIFKANPNFQKEELGKLQQILNNHPLLLKYLFIARTYTPESLYQLASKISLKESNKVLRKAK